MGGVPIAEQQHHLHPHQQHQQQQQQQQQQGMYHGNPSAGGDMSSHYPLYNPHSMSDGGGGYTLQTLGSPPGNNPMASVNRYSPQQQQQQIPQQQQQQQQQQQVGRITVECRPLQTEAEMHRISATTMAPPNWTGPALMPGVNTSPLGSNVSATPPSGDTSEESGDDCHSIAQVRHFQKIIRKIILKIQFKFPD
jgi:transcription initiation factor TFIID subunit TAF12